MNYMYTKKGVTTFQFTGEAKSIFDRFYFYNVMGSSQGSCTGAISGYDGSSGEMYMVVTNYFIPRPFSPFCCNLFMYYCF